VIVDEAGMVSTPDLWRLTDLAQRLDLRVVLVGDPHQLQAVARGGMFPEISTTATRTVELDQVHRFSQTWEAKASLRIRQGDPAALQQYLINGRVVAGSLDEHLGRISRRWIEMHQAGTTLAITTTTNEHASLINRHVQAARTNDGALNGASVAAADGNVFQGDVVMTRRNDRTIVTTDREPVRNRDRWTVTATHDDGSITARSSTSDATVNLPAAYVQEFVQLGYATTEHGNQGVTTDESITLVTGTTTGRGLYVGMTRGRQSNDVLVITDRPSEQEAMDVLGRALATDRADTPAVVHRRELAQRQPTPRLARRATEPEWLSGWRATIQDRLRTIDQRLASMGEQRPALEQTVARAGAALERAHAISAPREMEIAAARRRVDLDRTAVTESKAAVKHATWRTRRPLERALEEASERAMRSSQQLDELEAAFEPARQKRQQARVALGDAVERLDTHDRQVAELRLFRQDDTGLTGAMDTWRRWAAGHPMASADLATTAHELSCYVATTNEARASLATLAPDHPVLHQQARAIDRTEADYGIEL